MCEAVLDMCDESDDVLHKTLAQNAGIVGGSFKRYKFQLTTKRRHVASYMEHHSESLRVVFFLVKKSNILSRKGTFFCDVLSWGEDE